MKKAVVLLILFSFFSCGKKQEETMSEHLPHLADNDVIELSPREQVLINLKIDTVRIKTIYETITLLGKAAVDENKASVISSRVKGRLDKLFVRNPGENVKQGQALYSIYSEELLSEENEYLLALKQQAEFSSQKNTLAELILASKKKLLLWGLSEKQVAELEKNQSPSPLITFYGNVNGYLAELNVSEGEYVEPGTLLFKIAPLNSVWIEVQVYPYEMKYLQQKPVFMAEFESLPGETFNGNIVFESPAFERNSKISYIRIEIQDKGAKIKPGMMASVVVKTNEKTTLVIPGSAITLGEMPVVWVEKETGRFEMRRIHTGMATKTEVEILHGLKENEKVVVSGAYLVNSAYVLKHGTSMAGMQM